VFIVLQAIFWQDAPKGGLGHRCLCRILNLSSRTEPTNILLHNAGYIVKRCKIFAGSGAIVATYYDGVPIVIYTAFTHGYFKACAFSDAFREYQYGAHESGRGRCLQAVSYLYHYSYTSPFARLYGGILSRWMVTESSPPSGRFWPCALQSLAQACIWEEHRCKRVCQIPIFI